MKAIFILISLILCFSTIRAEDRTTAQILEAAKKALNERGINPVPFDTPIEFDSAGRAKRKAPVSAQLSILLDMDALTIAGMPSGGWAIIAKDENKKALRGYSSSTFDINNLPPSLVWYLHRLNDRLSQSDNNPQSPKQKRVLANLTLPDEVAPMLYTLWDQGYPHNRLAPKITIDGEEKTCLAGCTAIALAQVVNYYKRPSRGIGRQCYTYIDELGESRTIDEDLSAISWNFMNMIATFIGPYTNYHYEAVSSLVYACAVASNSKFGTATTTGYVNLSEWKEHLGFNPMFLDSDEQIYADCIAQGHPVLYGADSNDGGHLMVLDGYDKDGMFHVNFGWGGNHDGYIELDDEKGMSGHIYSGYGVVLDGDNYKKPYTSAGDGTSAEIDGIVYNLDTKNQTATFDCVKTSDNGEPYLDDITLCTSLNIDGLVYTLQPLDKPLFSGIDIASLTIDEGYTSMPENLCKDVALTSLVLPGTLVHIGRDAFNGGISERVTCRAAVPPATEGDVFGGKEKCRKTILYVPAESVAAYQQDNVWGKFGRISGIGEAVPASADSIIIDEIAYNIDGVSQEATVVGGNADDRNRVIIPDQITYDGYTYTVSSVAPEAFRKQTVLEYVEMPPTITSVGSMAFFGCESLLSVVIRASTLINIAEDAFGNELTNGRLFVPEEVVSDYTSSEAGKYLAGIYPIGTSPDELPHIYEPAPRYLAVVMTNGQADFWETSASLSISFYNNGYILVQGGSKGSRYRMDDVRILTYTDDPVDIEDSNISTPTFAYKDSRMQFGAGTTPLTVRIYNTAGILIQQLQVAANSQAQSGFLPQGTYIIETNNQTYKIIAK